MVLSSTLRFSSKKSMNRESLKRKWAGCYANGLTIAPSLRASPSSTSSSLTAIGSGVVLPAGDGEVEDVRHAIPVDVAAAGKRRTATDNRGTPERAADAPEVTNVDVSARRDSGGVVGIATCQLRGRGRVSIEWVERVRHPVAQV